ncbi:UDP-N-acetyl-D-mannosaminouronate:lipid I N-acetyl-D-mannosaminouronosyltransferase [Muriicola jejuensis]|uniref:WecB/TagA/CpsF family glycosyltransferase n=1 Tax=Muriicola jejuensis TaxID=504488 RepID=A0A6P0UF75_9FLAO|nr:WecB/TagA/CpsF family glycosyltransferase [Muriicola jejuensis]NER09903.1 WecB/TagA/CpsF family glycosyltransferase [Muriicola jejuensis]SMP04953.1 UDP-N-acetyl-D-mannosaminouronate:lipid I N-acetyl-D-mannosaminouronosyltransferase [Muriicola jejuensis]
MEIKTHVLNKKKIYAFTSKKEFLSFIRNKHKILIALNAEKLNKSDPKLDKIINENIGYPDGIGAVWALKRKGIRAVKIAGAEFWLDIIKQFKDSKSFYLIGSSQEVIDQTVQKLRSEFSELCLKGYRNGYLLEGDIEKIESELKLHKPDIVFIAMGSPKQEFLMERLMKYHSALYMGLGGSFDVYSGKKKRAPKGYQKFGLEWLYRLLNEPTRFGRQRSLIKFFFRIIFDRL